MRRGLFAACAIAVFAPAVASAAFVLRDNPPPLVPDNVPAEVPRVPRPKPALPRASGFGEDVPLRFAAAQIVPKDVRLEWAPEVDPEIEVTWHGGRPWNVVLAEAIQPHGYKLRVAGARATIAR